MSRSRNSRRGSEAGHSTRDLYKPGPMSWYPHSSQNKRLDRRLRRKQEQRDLEEEARSVDNEALDILHDYALETCEDYE